MIRCCANELIRIAQRRLWTALQTSEDANEKKLRWHLHQTQFERNALISFTSFSKPIPMKIVSAKITATATPPC